MKKIERIYLTNKQITERFNYDPYEQYVNMCYKLSFKFKNKSKQDFRDIFQESWIGVIIAHTTFKKEKGMSITSFVYKTINEHLYKFTIMNHDIIHIPYINKFWEKYGYNKIKVDNIKKELNIKVLNNEISVKKSEELFKKAKLDNIITKKQQIFESEIINDFQSEENVFDNFIMKNTTNEENNDFLNFLDDLYCNNIINKEEYNLLISFINKEERFSKEVKEIIEKIKIYVKNNNLESLF